MEFSTKTYSLAELYDISSGLSKKREEFGFGYPFLTFKEVFHNPFLPSKLEELANTTEKEQMRCSIKAGDVFLTRTSEKLEELGLSSVALKDYPQATFNGFTKRLRPNKLCKDILLPEYAAFYFRSLKFRNQVTSFSSMTTRASLNNEMISKLTIDIPSLAKQKTTVGVMLNLLEKEKNNKKTIQILEQLSQTLFKHWFIDFEFPNEQGQPYNSSGGEMVESELGEIPKEWKVSTLGTLIQNTLGGDWGKENPQGNYIEKVSIIRGADLPELKVGSDGKVPTRYILNKNYKNKKLEAGDIIIEISGGSPTQSTGRTLFINQEIINKYQDKVLCTNFCRILRPLKIEHGLWIELYISYLYKMNLFFNFENGTTGIKNLDLNAVLNNYKIVIPAEEILELFSKQFEILNSSIQKKGNENKKLEQLRDTLLPKLLSGEIEIPDDLEVK